MSQRHPLAESIAVLLERIHHGRAAEAMLAELDEEFVLGTDGSVGVAVVPMWAWKVSAISLGRKDRSYDGSGQRLLMPVRLVAGDDEPVRLYTGAQMPESLPVRENGLGHSSELDVKFLTCPDDDIECDEDGSLAAIPLRLLSPLETLRTLGDLQSRGKEALFSFMMLIEPWLKKHLEQARTYISRDTLDNPDDDSVMVTDWVSLETIADEMLVGAAEKPRGHMLDRLVAQCLSPTAFVNKEPSLHVKPALAALGPARIAASTPPATPGCARPAAVLAVVGGCDCAISGGQRSAGSTEARADAKPARVRAQRTGLRCARGPLPRALLSRAVALPPEAERPASHALRRRQPLRGPLSRRLRRDWLRRPHAPLRSPAPGLCLPRGPRPPGCSRTRAAPLRRVTTLAPREPIAAAAPQPHPQCALADAVPTRSAPAARARDSDPRATSRGDHRPGG